MSELYAGVDLGGTNIKAVLATAEGEVVVSDATETASHLGPDGVLERVAALVQELAGRAGTPPVALGMGVPGLLDLKRGISLFLPNFPTNWRNVPIREALQRALGCPVDILNDVRTATLGELMYGYGREVDSFVLFTIGTGIGGGVVIDRRLRLGPLGAAGELGHQTILGEGPLCGCGNRGCLEALASGPAIAAAGVRLIRNGLAPRLHELAGGDLNRVTPELMARAAEEGEESVRAELLRVAEYLGIGVANVVTALHPDLVLLGGGVAKMGDLLLEPVREVVRRRVRMFPVDGVVIDRPRLVENAGTLGGVALAVERRRGNFPFPGEAG
ncbi:MAG: ROK family protein [Acidobacteriota bacterium]